MRDSFAEPISAVSLQRVTELAGIAGYAQFLLAIGGVLFALGLLLLILANRLEARADSTTVKEAHRKLRARLGA